MEVNIFVNYINSLKFLKINIIIITLKIIYLYFIDNNIIYY